MLNYPQVALDFMNRDHAEFIDLRGKLLELLSAPSDTAAISTLLDQLLEHTRHHFAEEEQLMQDTLFFAYPMHKSEHDNVLAEMSARIGDWKQTHNNEILREWLERTVGDWFVNHVSTMDFVTAGFVAMKQQAG